MRLHESKGASQRQQSACAPPTLLSLPPELLERVLRLDNLRNCLAAAQVNHPLRRTAMDVVIKGAEDPEVLFAAVNAGSVEAVRALLKVGADPNCRNPAGEPLLLAYVLHGDIHYGVRDDILQTLLCGGADPEQTNTQGTTALHAAASNDDTEVVRLLLRHGTNKDALDADGFTPLMRALLSPCHPCIKSAFVLLAAGGSVHVQTPADKGGETALHLAAMYGDPRLVKALLAAGASRTLRNSDGDTALDLAEFFKCKAVAALLRQVDS